METVVTMEKVPPTPALILDEYLSQLKTPPKGEASSVAWAELVECLQATDELARLARGLL